MGRKFNRAYDMVITANDQTTINIKSEMGLTVEFDIQRNQLNSSNIGNFRIYNLSRDKRKKLRQDDNSVSVLRPVIFRAGYEDNMSDAFVGNVSTASSSRQGTNFITQVDCFGGSLALTQSVSSFTVQENTSVNSVLKRLLDDLNTQSGVKPGAIGNFDNTISTGTPMVGGTVDLIKERTNSGAFFIDNNKSYCLGDSECIKGAVAVIDSSFGIINTPVRNFAYITFDMLFEPRLEIGQFVTLNLSHFNEHNSSEINPEIGDVNGPYKITELKHKGIISPVVSGTAITTVQLFSGDNNFSTVPQL